MPTVLSQYSSTAPTSGSGLFIPVSALPGLTSAELTINTDIGALEYGRAYFAFLKGIYNFFRTTTRQILGQSFSYQESKPGSGLTNRRFTFTNSGVYALGLGFPVIQALPLNRATDDYCIQEIFPGAVYLVDGNPVETNTPLTGGIVFKPQSDIFYDKIPVNPYKAHGAPDAYVSSGYTNKDLLWYLLVSTATVDKDTLLRSSTVPSAFTNITQIGRAHV